MFIEVRQFIWLAVLMVAILPLYVGEPGHVDAIFESHRHEGLFARAVVDGFGA